MNKLVIATLIALGLITNAYATRIETQPIIYSNTVTFAVPPTAGQMIIQGTNSYDDGTGLNLQNNGIRLDGASDMDKDITWYDNGIAKWYAQIYRNENGDFWYLGNQEAQTIPFTISQGGRVGINKQMDIMNYHSRFIGTGLNDMKVGGVYAAKMVRQYKVVISGVGDPNTYQYAFKNDYGTYVTNATVYECSVTESNLERGVTVLFGSVSGHTIGDYWEFAGFPQLPSGSFTINPDMYTEILLQADKTVASYQDLTYYLSSLDDGNPNVILPTGTNAVLLLGSLMKRNSMYIDIAEPAVGMTLVLEYWNGNSWSNIPNTVNSLYESTSNLTHSGQIVWSKTVMADWAKTNLTVDDYVDEYYWIRLRSSTPITTPPQAITITPNGEYRLAVYGGHLDYEPTFWISGDGVPHCQNNASEDTAMVNYQMLTNRLATPYISLSLTNTITSSGTSSTNVIMYTDTDLAFRMALSGSNAIQVLYNGVYRIFPSVIASSSGVNKHCRVWIQQNGTNVPRTGMRILMPSAAVESMLSEEVFLVCRSNDLIRVCWGSLDDAGMQLIATPDTMGSASPAAVVVMQYMSFIE